MFMKKEKEKAIPEKIKKVHNKECEREREREREILGWETWDRKRLLENAEVGLFIQVGILLNILEDLNLCVNIFDC